MHGSAASERPAGGTQPVVMQRHLVRKVVSGACLVIVAVFVVEVALNKNMQWEVVVKYLFSAAILRGLWITIILTVVGMVIGTGLGVVLAAMKMSDAIVFRQIATGYIWLLRGIPLIVQLIFWFNLGLLFPRIGIGVPFTSVFIGTDANALISGFTAAILGLALHEAALMAEVIRGGILSVDRGQTEAATALGMYGGRVLRRIILPQAMRAIIPPTGNQLISLMKATSLVTVVAAGDLMTEAAAIYSSNFQIIPLLLVVSIWYLILTAVLSFFQGKLEAKYGRGFQ